MNLLPYDTFTIESPDPLPVVLEKLAPSIEPPQPIRWTLSHNHAPYEGTVDDLGFRIHRIIHYRNSFLPIIRGRFEAFPHRTLIHVRMGLHPVVTVFLGSWYLIWYSAFLPFYLSGEMPIRFAMGFLGLPLVGLGIFWLSFWYEAYRSRADLQRMILGEAAPAPLFLSTRPSTTLRGIQISLILLGMLFVLWQVTGDRRFFSPPSPSLPSRPVVCSDQPSPSPYCQFSKVYTLTGHTSVTALALSQDGQLLASGGDDKAIRIWDLTTGQLKQTLQSDSGKIRSLAIAPDNLTVVSGSADRMARIWSLTTEQPPILLAGHENDVTVVGFTADGKTIISGSYGAIKLWDRATGVLQRTVPDQVPQEIRLGPVTILADDPDQFKPIGLSARDQIALLDFDAVGLVVWDLTTNQEKVVLEGRSVFSNYPLSQMMNPDGTWAAIQVGNSFNKFETRLQVFDLTTGKKIAEAPMAFSQSTFSRVPVALSRDRIFGTTNGQLKVWNLSNATLDASLDAEGMNPLVVNDDGTLLAGVVGDPYFDNTTIQVFRRPL